MKCLILAAGYATRLFPLTENFPKPLLKVGDKAILDWLVDDLDASNTVDQFIVVSNHKFAEHFRQWAESKPVRITVVDDGTTANENRLGAVRDIQFAIDTLNIHDDLLVIAGDNLLEFSLSQFVSYAQEKGTSCVMRYYEPDKRKLTKSGVLEIDQADRVICMEEKPTSPKTNWCCPPFYYYTQTDTGLINAGIAAGCNSDAPGGFISWLCQQTTVHAMQMPGKRFDIGTLDSYQTIQSIYTKNAVCI